MNTLISPSQQVEMKRQQIKFQKYIVAAQCWRTCLNCEYWKDITKVVIAPDQTSTESYERHCSQYNMVPPPEILVHGCVEHAWGIPF